MELRILNRHTDPRGKRARDLASTAERRTGMRVVRTAGGLHYRNRCVTSSMIL
jgi:hypothetical protein